MEIDHPNIVKLEGVYESEDCIYLVQELCSGGDLFGRLDAQPEEHYSEAQCARLVKQMLSAVRSIAQRDLKLDFFCLIVLDLMLN
jgi:calcium-dependent protein kinase